MSLDQCIAFPVASASLPLAGDWNDDGIVDLGLCDLASGTFYLDADVDGLWNPSGDRAAAFGASGNLPLSGHWAATAMESLKAVGTHRACGSATPGHFHTDYAGLYWIWVYVRRLIEVGGRGTVAGHVVVRPKAATRGVSARQALGGGSQRPAPLAHDHDHRGSGARADAEGARS